MVHTIGTSYSLDYACSSTIDVFFLLLCLFPFTINCNNILPCQSTLALIEKSANFANQCLFNTSNPQIFSCMYSGGASSARRASRDYSDMASYLLYLRLLWVHIKIVFISFLVFFFSLWKHFYFNKLNLLKKNFPVATSPARLHQRTRLRLLVPTVCRTCDLASLRTYLFFHLAFSQLIQVHYKCLQLSGGAVNQARLSQAQIRPKHQKKD